MSTAPSAPALHDAGGKAALEGKLRGTDAIHIRAPGLILPRPSRRSWGTPPMSVTPAILLSLLAAQAGSELRKADRAVVVPAKGGSRIEIKDPAVIRSLESPATGDPKAPVQEDPA